MTDAVELVEVGPRDGLQNESEVLPTEAKVRFIDALTAAGHRRIEVTAFVSPKRIPQLADAADVMARIVRKEGVRYGALVPNAKGLERALRAGADEVAVFTASSETFNRKNINAGIDESFDRFRPVLEEAARRGLPVRGYLSTVLHCPYEGRIHPEVSLALAQRLLDLGCYEVSLGDTIGRATPGEVRELCELLEGKGILGRCAGHFHDTYGMGVANVLAAWDCGMRVFDSSSGGLGGCPYAPGASGNVATEDLLYLFDGLGVQVGCDLSAQVEATRIIETTIGWTPPGRVYGAMRGG
jgi:hydroxymethylglutaryl-CoA lyase